ncbi:hypothetical protein ACGFYQ_08655 [Streptomyces sp. NPDC048258]|uniref:hypothetical protein n=1 Tax=Streptomyces sp. NPDC048258 TaxID=3365527 RepID=UPI003714F50F
MRAELVKHDIVFVFARVKQELRELFDAYGLTAVVGANHVYPTLPTAIAGYPRLAARRRA